MAKRITLLANPARDQEADAFRTAAESAGLVIDELVADDASDIERVVRDAVESGADVVAAVGGDGTQRTVGAALAGSSARLGVVPGGTVNLLAQVLGIDSIDAAAQAISSGECRSFDIGVSNGDRFLLNTSSGYDADVIKRADAGNKERWGRLSFVAAAVSAFRSARPTGVAVTVDSERVFTGRALTVIVTNVEARSSGDLVIAPDAATDDGRLDVMIVRADSARSLGRVAGALMRGRAPEAGDLLRAQGADIDITWARTMAGQIDGDVAEPSRTFRIAVEPSALNVCTPPS